MMTDRLKRLQNLTRDVFIKANMQKYYEHTERVVGYTKILIDKYNVQKELVLAAAWIHDIGRVIDNTFLGHVQSLDKKGFFLLTEASFSDKEINEIINIANKHHPLSMCMISSIESQIIYDADNLDLVGAIGLMRWFDTFPSDTLQLKESAQMFIEIYNEAIKLKGRFFYTDEANIIGAGRLSNVLEYCNQMICEIDSIYMNNDYQLPMCQSYSKKNSNSVKGKRNIILLSGFRCSGKSYISSLISNLYGKYVTCFSTNSIKTGDSDANTIGPKEVIKRYGNNESYILFIKESLLNCYKQSQGALLIDSVKSLRDIEVIKSLFPNDNVYILWLQAKYDLRLLRYLERDIQTGIRNSSLKIHDSELVELGILNVMQEADAFIFSDGTENSIINELGMFISQIGLMDL